MVDIKIGLKEIVADFDLSSSNEYNRGLAILCEDTLNRLEQLEKENEELSRIKSGIQLLETHLVKSDTYYLVAKPTFFNTDYKRLLDDYIPKSVIREKIEELRKEKEKVGKLSFSIDRMQYLDILKGRIFLLESLLGKEK